jgi:transposase-like protein
MKKRTYTETVAVKDLKTNLFVRMSLDEDHVCNLADLLENGVKLPPITITPDHIVIDGRHRKEAYELCQIKEVVCEVIHGLSETEVIAMAYKANVGGPLPPTRKDTEHTVMTLLEQGVSKRGISSILGLPPQLARKYVDEVQSRMTRAKLLRAAAAVTEEGLTVAKAAETYGVDVNKLKELLSGRRRKHKQGIAEAKRQLTFAHKSLSSRNGRLMRELLVKLEDGDVNPRQVETIFAHVEQLQRRHARTITDWKKRFEAKMGKKP